MSNATKTRKNRSTVKDAVQDTLGTAPEAPVYSPPVDVRDLGKKHSHCVAASEKIENLYRDWAIEHVGPTLPQVMMQRAKLDENGAVIKDKDGMTVMCHWTEYDMGSDEMDKFGAEYKIGATADIIESGIHAYLCLPGMTVAATVALSDDEVGKLDTAKNEAAKAIRKAVRDLAYTRLSRARKWFSEANKAAKADATGTAKDPAAPFHQWIADDSKKGGLGLMLRRRKASADKFPDRTIDETTIKLCASLMSQGWTERNRKAFTTAIATVETKKTN